MKEIDFDINESPFKNFLSSRYSISSKIDIKNLWSYSKENDLSFFITSLGCLINSLNSVSVLRRRIIDGKVIEFDKLDAITPIIDTNDNILEIRLSPPSSFKSFKKWYDYALNEKEKVISGKKEVFSIPMSKRDEKPIANFSCIPWVDFDSITSCIENPHQVQPLVSWGKVNENKMMSVAITVNHILVYGKDLGKFYIEVQKNFDNFKI